MPRSVRSFFVALSLALVASLQPAVAAPPPAGCTAGDVEAAAADLYGPGAEAVTLNTVAGFPSAVVLTPEIHPGVRHRIVRAGHVWCDALTGFNAAWRMAGRPYDPAAMAEAYAILSPVTWFDGVRVRRLDPAAGGLYRLQTHARTNGVLASWTVTVDHSGVRSAAWVATHFAVPPFVPEWEGLTALPRARRGVARDSSGALRLDGPLLPTVVPPVESVFAEGVANDGFRIRFHHGDGPFGVTSTEPTGVAALDFMSFVRQVTLENYHEFLAWGLEQRWPLSTGHVYIDSAMSLVCLACVFASPEFNIHVSSQVVRLLELFGNRYPDPAKAFSLVIGHEMFHNFQNAYGELWETRAFGGYTEGTARFQETLHSYADVSHQRQSLVYASDVNGCNGYIPGGVHVGPPGQLHLYDACLFWMTWYPTHGVSGLVGLLEAMHVALRSHPSPWEKFKAAVEAVTGRDVASDLARFAERILTKLDMSWGPATGGGPVLNWGQFLVSWRPAVVAAGGSVSGSLSQGGMLGADVRAAGQVVLAGATAATRLFQVRWTGATSTLTELSPGATVAAPASNERVWLVAIEPADRVANVTLRYEAL